MGVVKTVSIKVDPKEAVSGIQKINKEFETLSKTVEGLEKEISETTDPKKLSFLKKQLADVNKELGKTEEGFKNSNKKANIFKRTISGIGTAIKAAGIGLLISAVAGLTSAIGSNTKVSKVFKEVFETISLAFGSFVMAIVDAIEEVGKAEGQFNALKKVVLSSMTLALTPFKILLGGLKNVFFSTQQTIQKLQLAWENSWLGGKGKDKERIKELEKAIKETDESIKKTGESILKAGKDGFDAFKTVGKNIGEAIDEVSKVTKKSIENVSKINLKEIEKQAKALVRLRGESALAIAQNELILKTKQKEAEIQRQIRDETENDVATRIEANKKLQKILEESNKLQLANAQKAIDLQKAEVSASGGSLDSKLALIQAETNYQDVLETTEGFLSEQKTNRTALSQEEIDLEQSVIDAKNQRLLSEKEFQAEQEENELLKIENLKENIDFENQILLDDLERKKELYKEGTQARVDAEQEYLDAKQELDQKEIQLDKQVSENKKKSAVAESNTRIKLAGKTSEFLKTIATEGSELAKGVAVAQATINTFQGVTSELATKTTTPLGFALKLANIASVTAIGFKSVQDILATNATGSSSSVSPSSGGSTPQVQAPSFNLVQGTGTDQIADSIQNQDRPIKTYVVSSDMTSQQELDRNAKETATL